MGPGPFLLLSILMAGFLCAAVLLTVLAGIEEKDGRAAESRRAAFLALLLIIGATSVNIAFSRWLGNPYPLVGIICYAPLLAANIGRYRRMKRADPS